jgi:hypothetical protein
MCATSDAVPLRSELSFTESRAPQRSRWSRRSVKGSVIRSEGARETVFSIGSVGTVQVLHRSGGWLGPLGIQTVLDRQGAGAIAGSSVATRDLPDSGERRLGETYH